MTFQQIRYVLEIARCGSISKATRNLFVAQPYLSNLLRDLEQEIGIQIFIRTNRGVELTREGSEFLGYVRPLIEQHDKILEMYQGGIEPGVHFSVSTQRYPFITKSFVEFMQAQTADKYEYHIREVGMYRVIEDVYEAKSELGIIFISNTNERFLKKVLSSKGLDFHEIKRITPCVYFGKHHPMAAVEAVRIGDMSIFPYAVFEEDDSISIDFSEEVVLYDFVPSKKMIYLADRATMMNLLAHTDAYSVGSGILPPGYADACITARPILGHENEMKLGWIKRTGRAITEEMTAFVEQVTRNIES